MKNNSLANQTPPNVLVLIGNFMANSGGAQRAIANQIQQSAGESCRYIVCHLFGEGSLKEQLPTKTKVIALGASYAFDFSILARLKRVVNENEIDIIHTHSNIAGIWGRLLKKFYKHDLHIISTEQNTHQRYRNAIGLVNGLTLPWADKIVAVSDSTRDSFFGWERRLLKGRDVLTIHNAVDTQEFATLNRDGCKVLRDELNLSGDSLLLGNVARMDSQKNQQHMIEEFALISDDCPDAKLLIIGRGDLGKQLQKVISEKGLEDRVKLVGPRTDMHNVYRMLDIFLLPSLYEGFSLALLEAMAIGLPIVCSNIPQITEATEDTALAVPPQERGALAKAMKRMIQDPSLRDEYSKKAKARALAMFDASMLAQRYEKLYLQLNNNQAS